MDSLGNPIFFLGNPIELPQDGVFVVALPSPPDDGRCIAGWGYPADRCAEKRITPDWLCLRCAIDFAPQGKS